MKGRVHGEKMAAKYGLAKLALITRISVTIFTVIIASPILPLSQTDMAANYCV